MTSFQGRFDYYKKLQIELIFGAYWVLVTNKIIYTYVIDSGQNLIITCTLITSMCQVLLEQWDSKKFIYFSQNVSRYCDIFFIWFLLQQQQQAILVGEWLEIFVDQAIVFEVKICWSPLSIFFIKSGQDSFD